MYTFPISFKKSYIVDWDEVRSSANLWVVLHGLLSTNSLKASWFTTDEGLGSFLNDVLPEWKFEKQFWTWRSSNNTLAKKTQEIFSAVSVAFFFLLVLNPHDIQWQICTFSFSLFRVWDWESVYDAYSFMIEISMTGEGTL